MNEKGVLSELMRGMIIISYIFTDTHENAIVTTSEAIIIKFMQNR